jgi:hypothetical protein
VPLTCKSGDSELHGGLECAVERRVLELLLCAWIGSGGGGRRTTRKQARARKDNNLRGSEGERERQVARGDTTACACALPVASAVS